ncbi:MAG: hypothetical protein AAGA54_13780 [Myxococcota bacterium]
MVASAAAAVKGTDLVFADPDNGLETKSAREGQARIIKYVRYADLQQLRARGHSLVIYHHLGRTGGTHPEQVATLRSGLVDRLGLERRPAALTFRRGSARTFFIVPAASHEEASRERLDALSQTASATAFDRTPDVETKGSSQSEA